MYHIIFDRPHNEAVEVLIKFGLLGLTFWIVMITKLGIALAGRKNKALGLSLFLLMVVSMLTDSTTNTQAGAIFALGFMGLCLSKEKNENLATTSY
jgi:O-antigen ligase